MLEPMIPGFLNEIGRFWREAYAAEPSFWFPETGFAVRGDFWREFQRFGGVPSLQNGEIVLLHFNGNDIGALPAIIEMARQRGLQPVTISELFG